MSWSIRSRRTFPPRSARAPALGPGAIGAAVLGDATCASTKAGSAFREPPTALQAEQCLLGSLLANNRHLHLVADRLQPCHFADPAHQRLFSDIRRRVSEGKVADVVTLRTLYQNSGVLQEVCGAEYLAQLLTTCMPPSVLQPYAELIRDRWLRRQMIDLAEGTIGRACVSDGDDEPAERVAAEAAAALMALAHGDERDSMTAAGEAVASALRAAETAAADGEAIGAPTGLKDLDAMLGGLRPGQMVVAAGRPGMGKTVFGAAAASAAACAGHQVVFVSLEMGAEELGERLAAAATGIAGDRIRSGRLAPEEWRRLAEAEAMVRGLPLLIDDLPRRSLDDILMRCRAAACRRPVGLVVVDHLGLVEAPREVARHGPTAATEHVSKGLKQLAKAVNAPVLALCQLNRALEARDDKRPVLADLRQSGSIEQDADVVLLLHRDEYHLDRGAPSRRGDESEHRHQERLLAHEAALERVRGRIDLIVAKQRRGATGTIHAKFDGATSRIWCEHPGRTHGQ